MKTAKKFLCLMLVLIMALGMVQLAVATDFTDDADIKYKDAADVLSTIGVIDGYPDGSFGPERNITRAEAATIVVRLMVGKAAADALRNTSNATKFSDVSASHWASGLVAYCVSQGVIAGYPDGTFQPDKNVTAAEFAIMLLRALGYGKNNEYSGNTWLTNAIVDGMRLRILRGDKNFADVATRDECAYYAFNCLLLDMVVFSKDKEAYEPTNPRTNLAARSFPLLKVAYVPDAFGRPSQEWAFMGKVIGSYPQEATFTFTATTRENDVRNLIRGYTFATATSLAGTPSSMVNGRPVAAPSTAAAIAALTGNGILVEIYADVNREMTDFVVIKTDTTQVQSINTAARSVTLATKNAAGTVQTPYIINDQMDLYDVVKDLKVDDYALVIGVWNGSTYDADSIAFPTTVAGNITARNSTTGALTVGGSAYQTAAAATANVSGARPGTTESTLYLDTYGYVVDVKGPPPAASINYLLVTDYYTTIIDGRLVTMVAGVHTDGSEVEVRTNSTITRNGLYAASVSNNIYTLTYISAGSVIGSTTTAATVTSIAIGGGTARIRATDTRLSTLMGTNYNNVFASGVSFIYYSINATTGDCTYSILKGMQTINSLPANSIAVVEERGPNTWVVTAVFIPDAALVSMNEILFVAGYTGDVLLSDNKSYEVFTAYMSGVAITDGIPTLSTPTPNRFFTYSLNTAGGYVLSPYTANSGKQAVITGATLNTPFDNRLIYFGGTELVIDSAMIIDVRPMPQQTATPITSSAAGICYAVRGDSTAGVAPLNVEASVLYDADTSVAEYIFITAAS